MDSVYTHISHHKTIIVRMNELPWLRSSLAVGAMNHATIDRSSSVWFLYKAAN